MSRISRRGRPRLNRPSKDLGTPELIAKRQQGLTKEPLDLLCERQIISPVHHDAGMHFRWLHSIQFGVPRPSAYDHSYLGGAPLDEDNPHWLRIQMEKYNQANDELCRIGAKHAIRQICVFLEMPTISEWMYVRNGLNMLHKLFRG